MSDWREIEKNRTFVAMRRVRELAELVVTGKKQTQMFCSTPGLGKTETVLEVLASNNLKPYYSSPATVQGFCADLWLHQNRPYFLDDCDILANDQRLANVAKMAWGPQRLVIVPASLRIQKNEEFRLQGSGKYDPTIPPPTFRLGVRHTMLWNANRNYTDPDVVRKNMAPDFAALISRGLDPLWIPNAPQDVLNYTIWMIVNGMLRRHRQGSQGTEGGGFSLMQQQEVLEFLCTHGRRLRELTPRMAWKLATARRYDPHYEDAWREQLSTDVLYPSLVLPEETPRLVSPATRRATLVPVDASDDPTAGQEETSPASGEDIAPPKAAPTAPITETILAAAIELKQPYVPDTSRAAGANAEVAVAPLRRDVITQDIAKMFYGRLRMARITATTGGLIIDAYNESRTLISHSELAPQPAVVGEYVIEVLRKEKGGRYLVIELPTVERDRITIKPIEWDGRFGPDAGAEIVAACKNAKEAKEETLSIDVIDGTLSLVPGKFRFARRDLEWVLRNGLATIKFSKRGVLAVTALGIAGEYEFFLRCQQPK